MESLSAKTKRAYRRGALGEGGGQGKGGIEKRIAIMENQEERIISTQKTWMMEFHVGNGP